MESQQLFQSTTTSLSLTRCMCLVQHPGFDFSGAEVSGEAPNPRTFLGGLRH